MISLRTLHCEAMAMCKKVSGSQGASSFYSSYWFFVAMTKREGRGKGPPLVRCRLISSTVMNDHEFQTTLGSIMDRQGHTLSFQRHKDVV